MLLIHLATIMVLIWLINYHFLGCALLDPSTNNEAASVG